jgi:hypothetical protein
MSYNIDTWRTKKIVDLRIPLSLVQEVEHAEIKLDKNGLATAYNYSEGFKMTGQIVGDVFIADFIINYGDGSGTFHQDTFVERWLPQSTGELEAVLVWEGGDSITRLICKDGVVEEKEVDF